MSQVNAGDFFGRQYLTATNGFNIVLDTTSHVEEGQVFREGTVTVTVLGLERTLPFKLLSGFLSTEVDAVLANEEHGYLLQKRIVSELESAVTGDCKLVRVSFNGELIHGTEVAAV